MLSLDYTDLIELGGPGSGFFRHAGIPDFIGGSLPKGVFKDHHTGELVIAIKGIAKRIPIINNTGKRLRGLTNLVQGVEKIVSPDIANMYKEKNIYVAESLKKFFNKNVHSIIINPNPVKGWSRGVELRPDGELHVLEEVLHLDSRNIAGYISSIERNVRTIKGINSLSSYQNYDSFVADYFGGGDILKNNKNILKNAYMKILRRRGVASEVNLERARKVARTMPLTHYTGMSSIADGLKKNEWNFDLLSDAEVTSRQYEIPRKEFFMHVAAQQGNDRIAEDGLFVFTNFSRRSRYSRGHDVGILIDQRAAGEIENVRVSPEGSLMRFSSPDKKIGSMRFWGKATTGKDYIDEILPLHLLSKLRGSRADRFEFWGEVLFPGRIPAKYVMGYHVLDAKKKSELMKLGIPSNKIFVGPRAPHVLNGEFISNDRISESNYVLQEDISKDEGLISLGGPNSGYHGHAGRPGKVGGSSSKKVFSVRGQVLPAITVRAKNLDREETTKRLTNLIYSEFSDKDIKQLQKVTSIKVLPAYTRAGRMAGYISVYEPVIYLDNNYFKNNGDGYIAGVLYHEMTHVLHHGPLLPNEFDPWSGKPKAAQTWNPIANWKELRKYELKKEIDVEVDATDRTISWMRHKMKTQKMSPDLRKQYEDHLEDETRYGKIMKGAAKLQIWEKKPELLSRIFQLEESSNITVIDVINYYLNNQSPYEQLGLWASDNTIHEDVRRFASMLLTSALRGE